MNKTAGHNPASETENALKRVQSCPADISSVLQRPFRPSLGLQIPGGWRGRPVINKNPTDHFCPFFANLTH